MIETILLWAIALLVLLAIVFVGRKEEKRCPKCRGELTDVGFEGWKKRCDDCGWKS